jgi:hypothetical protein
VFVRLNELRLYLLERLLFVGAEFAKTLSHLLRPILEESGITRNVSLSARIELSDATPGIKQPAGALLVAKDRTREGAVAGIATLAGRGFAYAKRDRIVAGIASAAASITHAILRIEITAVFLQELLTTRGLLFFFALLFLRLTRLFFVLAGLLLEQLQVFGLELPIVGRDLEPEVFRAGEQFHLLFAHVDVLAGLFQHLFAVRRLGGDPLF